MQTNARNQDEGDADEPLPRDYERSIRPFGIYAVNHKYVVAKVEHNHIYERKSPERVY